MSVGLGDHATKETLCRTHDAGYLPLRKAPRVHFAVSAFGGIVRSKYQARAGNGMDDDDRVVQVSDSAVRNELAQLRQEHRDLDSAIEALQGQASPDNLQIQRLKKRKLLLKDQMAERIRSYESSHATA